jgi:uncharacterized membrane protein
VSENVFEPMDPISFGWNTLKGNLGFFVILMIIVGVLYNLPGLISMAVSSAMLPDPASGSFSSGTTGLLALFAVIIAIISLIIYILLEVGLLKIALSFRDGKVPDVEDLFRGYPHFLNYLAASILYGLMVAIGLILLIIPGIYLALKYQFYGYLIVDKGMGPIKALKESGRITDGAKKDLLIFWLVLFCSIAVIALVLGIFIALPVGLLMAFISKELIPVFNIATSLISSFINLIIIIPITKLSTAFIYRILEARLASPAITESNDIEKANIGS